MTEAKAYATNNKNEIEYKARSLIFEIRRKEPGIHYQVQIEYNKNYVF